MKSVSRKFLATAAAIAALASAASLQAVTFNLYTGGTSVGSGAGNSRTWTDVGTGISVTVTAHSQTNVASSTFSNSYVGQYSSGLGVTNANESGGDPTHKVDNRDSGSGDSAPANDYLKFTFNQEVDINQFVFGSVGDDADHKIWISNSATLLSGTAITYDLAGDQGSDGTRTVNASSLFGQFIILAANPYVAGGDNDDEFKVYSLDVSPKPPGTPGVPDNGSTLVLLGLTIVGLAALRKQSRA